MEQAVHGIAKFSAIGELMTYACICDGAISQGRSQDQCQNAKGKKTVELSRLIVTLSLFPMSLTYL
jgi:hypothetical protein